MSSPNSKKIKLVEEIFEWANEIHFESQEIGIIYGEGVQVLWANMWGHPGRSDRFYVPGKKNSSYWSRLFLMKNREFKYVVGFKYMAPMKVITISNSKDLLKFHLDYVEAVHSKIFEKWPSSTNKLGNVYINNDVLDRLISEQEDLN